MELTQELKNWYCQKEDAYLDQMEVLMWGNDSDPVLGGLCGAVKKP